MPPRFVEVGIDPAIDLFGLVRGDVAHAIPAHPAGDDDLRDSPLKRVEVARIGQPEHLSVDFSCGVGAGEAASCAEHPVRIGLSVELLGKDGIVRPDQRLLPRGEAFDDPAARPERELVSKVGAVRNPDAIVLLSRVANERRVVIAVRLVGPADADDAGGRVHPAHVNEARRLIDEIGLALQLQRHVVDLASERTVLLENDVARLVRHDKEPGIGSGLVDRLRGAVAGRIDAHVDNGRRLAGVHAEFYRSGAAGHFEGDAVDLP